MSSPVSSPCRGLRNDLDASGIGAWFVRIAGESGSGGGSGSGSGSSSSGTQRSESIEPTQSVDNFVWLLSVSGECGVACYLQM